jgi:hypothetical protein
MSHHDQKISYETVLPMPAEAKEQLEVVAGVKYPSAGFQSSARFGERGCYEGGCDAQSPDPGPGLDVLYHDGLQQIRRNSGFS